MSNTDIKTSQLPQTALIANSDLFVVVRNPSTTPSTNTYSYGNLRASVVQQYTPANSISIVANQGLLFYDSSYLYITTANNYVKRVALSSF